MAQTFRIRSGVVTTIYTEKVDLARLGPLRVERASHVEFDNVARAWTATLPSGAAIPGGPWKSRAEALAAEVAWLEDRLRKGE